MMHGQRNIKLNIYYSIKYYIYIYYRNWPDIEFSDFVCLVNEYVFACYT